MDPSYGFFNLVRHPEFAMPFSPGFGHLTILGTVLALAPIDSLIYGLHTVLGPLEKALTF